eukprot:TRINITY_DN925_c0_g2_i1.p1 TRINITY_DN925_c0_g2~~TRINITY_DN925_c0_g2_i1.p1  ORF type:complete len:552 (-),score=70.24 TRINITY_DN925_c0_g2_i1:600-2255(-)
MYSQYLKQVLCFLLILQGQGQSLENGDQEGVADDDTSVSPFANFEFVYSNGTLVKDQTVIDAALESIRLWEFIQAKPAAEYLPLLGFNLTETPFTLAFYGAFFDADPNGFSQETPILHRLLMYYFVTYYEVWACVHDRPSMVGLTVCDGEAAKDFDKSQESAAMLYAGIAHGNAIQTTTWQDSLVKVLKELGYDEDNTTMDMNTPAGLGNLVGKALFEYQLSDGWDVTGLLSRTVNPMPFEDYTGYAPMNPPEKLIYPLRWQPLLESDGQGFFYFQQHVTPQAAQVEPLTMSMEELMSKTVAWPYTGDKEVTELNAEDEAAIRSYAEELFQMSSGLTDIQKMLIYQFDSKLRILALLAFNFARAQTVKDNNRQLLTQVGVEIALYDSTILAWKEKLLHDAVRPPSIIAHLYGDELVEAWGGIGKGSMQIKAKEFSPYVRTMPHSEFPSASACVCEAMTEFMIQVEKGNDPVDVPLAAPFPKGSSSIEPGVVPEKDLVVVFESYQEVSEMCGESRLWGGMHFRPAVEAARQLCKGVGIRVYERLAEVSGIEF